MSDVRSTASATARRHRDILTASIVVLISIAAFDLRPDDRVTIRGQPWLPLPFTCPFLATTGRLVPAADSPAQWCTWPTETLSLHGGAIARHPPGRGPDPSDAVSAARLVPASRSPDLASAANRARLRFARSGLGRWLIDLRQELHF